MSTTLGALDVKRVSTNWVGVFIDLTDHGYTALADDLSGIGETNRVDGGVTVKVDVDNDKDMATRMRIINHVAWNWWLTLSPSQKERFIRTTSPA